MEADSSAGIAWSRSRQSNTGNQVPRLLCVVPIGDDRCVNNESGSGGGQDVDER